MSNAARPSTRAAAGGAPASRGLTDTAALKSANPIEVVLARYGVELRRSGRALVGRCPLHDDRGRPNFYVYPDQDSWFCYRCNVGGDAISLVERVERVGFREAVSRLGGAVPLASASRARPAPGVPGVAAGPPRPARHTYRRVIPPRGPEERACLAAAVELYHNRLLGDPAALAYTEERGLDRETLVRCRVGYAPGDELASYLRWRRIPAQAGLHSGLLRPDGSELMAGRMVVPEIRAGRVLWLVGRTLPAAGGEAPERSDGSDKSPAHRAPAPKYLGLPGTKPLLGWDEASKSPTVFLTEGVFDYLTLSCWGFPALALVGTRVRLEVVRELARFRRVYVLLDSDEAGQTATAALLRELAEAGTDGVPVTLPDGVKDVAELATVPGGQDVFAAAVLRAARAAGVPRVPDAPLPQESVDGPAHRAPANHLRPAV